MKLLKTPLNMDSLYKEVVNLLFQNYKLTTCLHRKSTFSFLTSRNKKELLCSSLKVNSVNLILRCLVLTYKLFQLVMRVKSDKNIVNIPP